MSLLLAVWREVCRHREIGDVAERVARLLSEHIPVEYLAVRRLDLVQRRLETLAAVPCRAGAASPPALRTELAAGEAEALLAWAHRGRVLRGVAGDGDSLATLLAPPGTVGEVILGPLAAEGGTIGVLALHAAPARRLTDAHAEIAQSLLEPLAVALANAGRIHELAQLRDALEADKRALLARLGRNDLADAIIGADGGLREVLQRAYQVAATNAPVLILGETGSGKEVIARAIHARSARAGAPFERVNCGALPPGLVDSELFGHERGSFTGAIASRRGWFERADGGTLFLDEVGELPLEAQVRLLRILQDGTFERVGGQKTLSVDVRIVAATHRALREMTARGAFREDLWYRLSVFPIHLPPLRERPEDIPALAMHFAWRAGQRLRGAPLVPTAEQLDLLLAYPWPGNVRELAAVIERAAILGDGHRLDVAGALGVSAPRLPPRAPQPAAEVAPPPEEIVPLDVAMARHIERALAACQGRIEGKRGAAALLGINPHTLRARMRKLGVDWTRFRRAAASQ